MDTNWPEKIKALEASGMSLTEIGEAIGLTTGAVSDVKQGRTSNPRGMAAVKLHQLHVDKCGADPAKATKRRKAA